MTDDNGNRISVHELDKNLLIVVDYDGGGHTSMYMHDMASIKFWAGTLKKVSDNYDATT